MIEKSIMDLLSPLVGDRVFFDQAPQGTPKPYITLLQVGGNNIAFVEGASDNDQVRIQIDVFAGSRTEANDIMTQARSLVCSEPLRGAVVGAPVSVHEASVQTFRRFCDFSFLTQI